MFVSMYTTIIRNNNIYLDSSKKFSGQLKTVFACAPLFAYFIKAVFVTGHTIVGMATFIIRTRGPAIAIIWSL